MPSTAISSFSAILPALYVSHGAPLFAVEPGSTGPVLTRWGGDLRAKHPDARVVGHRDLSPDQNANGIVESFEWLKTCPGFDVAAWLESGMTAPEVPV